MLECGTEMSFRIGTKASSSDHSNELSIIKRRIYSLAERLLASNERLWSMELVLYMKDKPINWFTQVLLNASTKQTEFIN
jgi:hypothetical protein